MTKTNACKQILIVMRTVTGFVKNENFAQKIRQKYTKFVYHDNFNDFRKPKVTAIKKEL